jgi:hypothetical protein
VNSNLASLFNLVKKGKTETSKDAKKLSLQQPSLVPPPLSWKPQQVQGSSYLLTGAPDEKKDKIIDVGFEGGGGGGGGGGDGDEGENPEDEEKDEEEEQDDSNFSMTNDDDEFDEDKDMNIDDGLGGDVQTDMQSLITKTEIGFFFFF